ncbi:MAG: hypothetical protein IK109_06305, partial [Clostridiales bacterium]|nr:hypothetical protein [Clostridiales bacterium]
IFAEVRFPGEKSHQRLKHVKDHDLHHYYTSFCRSSTAALCEILPGTVNAPDLTPSFFQIHDNKHAEAEGRYNKYRPLALN